MGKRVALFFLANSSVSTDLFCGFSPFFWRFGSFFWVEMTSRSPKRLPRFTIHGPRVGWGRSLRQSVDPETQKVSQEAGEQRSRGGFSIGSLYFFSFSSPFIYFSIFIDFFKKTMVDIMFFFCLFECFLFVLNRFRLLFSLLFWLKDIILVLLLF